MYRRTFLLAAPALLIARRLRAAEEPVMIRELYNKNKSFSELAIALEGKRVTFTGFMAPPLKAEAHFFVLTQRPMAVCPFCEPGAEWPSDILPVFTKRVVDPTAFNLRIESTGVFTMEPHTDPETGFYSRVRLTDAIYG